MHETDSLFVRLLHSIQDATVPVLEQDVKGKPDLKGE